MAILRIRLTLLGIAFATPALLSQSSTAQTDLKYQLPPAVMVKLVDAPVPPMVSLSPEHGSGPRMLLIEQRAPLPTIADLAEPELRLAGLRFNPTTGAPCLISTKVQSGFVEHWPPVQVPPKACAS